MQKSLLVSALVAAVSAPGVLAAQQTPTPTPPVPSAPTAPAPVTDSTTDSLVTRSANGDVEQGSNVLDVARKAGNFTTLVRAIEAAGLAETLQGEGPFTLFAPTDEAFAKLPQEQLDALLADPAQLKVLLLGHVVPSKVTTADAASQSAATTVTGGSLAIAAQDSNVTVNGAKVVQADLAASNGVVHAVDAVILPASAAPATDSTAEPKSDTQPAEPAPAPAPTLPEPGAPSTPSTPSEPGAPSMPSMPSTPSSPSVPPAPSIPPVL